MPNTPNVQSAYALFLEKGVIGAVAVLAIGALIWTIVKLLVSKDERIKDQALFAAALLKTSENVSALAIEVNKSTVVAMSDAGRSAHAVTISIQSLEKAVASLEKEVSSLENEVSSLRDEQVRLVAALASGRPVIRGRR